LATSGFKRRTASRQAVSRKVRFIGGSDQVNLLEYSKFPSNQALKNLLWADFGGQNEGYGHKAFDKEHVEAFLERSNKILEKLGGMG